MKLTIFILTTLLFSASWQDHAAKGKAARQSGDCVKALKHYTIAFNAPDLPTGQSPT